MVFPGAFKTGCLDVFLNRLKINGFSNKANGFRLSLLRVIAGFKIWAIYMEKLV